MSKSCASLPPMDKKATTPPAAQSETVNSSRRKLLKVTAYVAPAILGSLMASSAAAKPGPPCSPASPPACSCTPNGLGTPSCP
jgi:hypothetical protein